MNITHGKIGGALKVVIYGPEGIGKSTFASCFPGAVFCDTEGSTNHMDVARFDKPEKWMDIHAAIDWAIEHPSEVGTFVLDTADWAEKLGTRYVCKEEETDKKGTVRDWDNIESPGYGKGYVYLKAAFQKLLDKLTVLTEKGVNVVITAHAILKKFEQPDEMGSYDRWSMKLNEKNVAPLVKEWADIVLFANYKTSVVKNSDGKNKARGGQKRVMYTQHNACWDAKNRFDLDEELPFEYEQIAHLLTSQSATPAAPDPDPVQAPEPAPSAPTPADQDDNMRFIPIKGKSRKKPSEKPTERPETMKSDDPAKDKLLAKVWKNMVDAGVYDPLSLQAVVAQRGYYDGAIPVKDYEADFIEGCLIEAWDKVKGLCQEVFYDLPF